ncbi:MAG: MBL fold metallo-hydrolase [Gemmatirosa sp.]|nr:MBL fold metallo-hydrolase [Gemmatirosa sp.]
MSSMQPFGAAMSRRRFFVTLGCVGAAAAVAPRRLLAGDPSVGGVALDALDAIDALGPVQMIRSAATTDPIRVEPLRGNLRVLSGSGGNIAALPGRDGVLLVDSGIVGSKVAAAVTTFSAVPVRHVINSHWHFDHTDANAWLHARGASILAQETTRARLMRDTRVDDWDFTFPRSPAGALPATTFRDEHELTLNGARVALRRYEPAHTDCDIAVHFTDADVLHVADTWWNGVYPFIDYSTGGSIDGMIRATERNLGVASATTIIIPGHGDVGDREALRRWRDMLVGVRDRVAALKSQGRSVDETVAAKPTAPFDAAYDNPLIGADFFTRLVYKGV